VDKAEEEAVERKRMVVARLRWAGLQATCRPFRSYMTTDRRLLEIIDEAIRGPHAG